MKLCDFGCKQKAEFVLKNGKKCCSKSANSCPAMRNKNSKTNKERLQGKMPSHVNKEFLNKIGFKKNHNTWNKGKSYKELMDIKQWECYRKKLSDSHHSSGIASTPEKEIERKRKISESIKERYKKGWMPKAGRCKKIHYNSTICGDVLLDGSWELAFAKYLDKNNINWDRNKARFVYVFEEKERHYTPDFFLPDRELYVEVKGYETEKDRAKWSQFPHEIIIIRKEEIKQINCGQIIEL